MGNKGYIIWFHLQNEKEREVYYCFDKKNKNDAFPVILDYVLNKENGYSLKEPTNPYLEGYYPIRLIIHSADDILKGQASESLDVFNQKNLKDENDINIVIDDEDPQKSKIIDGVKIPIIHLALTDLYIESLYGVDPLPNPVPRSYMIMDNSIWNYLVPLADAFYIHDLVEYRIQKEKDKSVLRNKAKRGGVENFFQVVKSICNNYDKNLYRLKVAQEFADLNARLAEQSYLSGAHASGVSPFIFHSETTAKQLVQREFRIKEDSLDFPYDKGNKYDIGSIMDRICKHRWRILLLDDKAIKSMETKPTNPLLDDNNGGWNCKLTIIRDLLENQLDLQGKVSFRPCCDVSTSIEIKGDIDNSICVKLEKDTAILIEYAQSIEEAKLALSNRQYDLVLIDYLLNQSDGTHYGYELLDEIWNDQQLHKNKEKSSKYKIYPHRSQRLYCMFISAYSYAVHDRLLAEGLNQSEDYWFISLGACPTNTPQLFLYNLLKLMEKRLDDSGILELSLNKIYKLIYDIYADPDIPVRKSANKYYQKVLSLQYHYRNILKNVEIPFKDKSEIYETKCLLFMTDFIQKKINLGGMLEHLTQLVHLTAFGTVRQWPEMWEEYIYFKAQFEKELKAEEKDGYQELFESIETHIKKLKSQQV